MDEVRDVGLFSNRDRAILNKDKTLIITLMRRGRMKVEVFGNDGAIAGYDWLKAEEGKPNDIYLYRGKAGGRIKKAEKTLRFFSSLRLYLHL